MSKPQILHGVPYAVNNLSQALAYQSDTQAPVLFGSVQTSVGSKAALQLTPDWRVKAEPFLQAYRESLRRKTEEKLATRTTTL